MVLILISQKRQEFCRFSMTKTPDSQQYNIIKTVWRYSQYCSLLCYIYVISDFQIKRTEWGRDRGGEIKCRDINRTRKTQVKWMVACAMSQLLIALKSKLWPWFKASNSAPMKPNQTLFTTQRFLWSHAMCFNHSDKREIKTYVQIVCGGESHRIALLFLCDWKVWKRRHSSLAEWDLFTDSLLFYDAVAAEPLPVRSPHCA